MMRIRTLGLLIVLAAGLAGCATASVAEVTVMPRGTLERHMRYYVEPLDVSHIVLSSAERLDQKAKLPPVTLAELDMQQANRSLRGMIRRRGINVNLAETDERAPECLLITPRIVEVRRFEAIDVIGMAPVVIPVPVEKLAVELEAGIAASDGQEIGRVRIRSGHAQFYDAVAEIGEALGSYINKHAR